jgi:methionine sulfoxide reductase heme-binding subunit
MTSSALDSALWAFGRGTGLAALGLLTLSVVLGVLARSGRPLPWIGKVGVSDLHRTAALTGTALVGAHLGTLLLDPYSQLRVVDLAFPFLASYRPVYLGLGTLAVDLLLLVTLVSVLRARVGPRVFRVVHWLTYALWPIALGHALGSGTDAGTSWFRAFAVVCIVLVTVVAGWRVAPSFTGRGWQRHPRRAA